MNRLSSQKNVIWLFLWLLAVSGLCSGCLGESHNFPAEPTRAASRFDFQKYGYEVSGQP
jgi:hypothetical protein